MKFFKNFKFRFDFKNNLKKTLKSPKKLFILFVLGYYSDNIRLALSESYNTKSCLNDLRDRFEFSGKFSTDTHHKKRPCTIHPSNIYDLQKIIEIANFYNIPILNDINDNEIDFIDNIKFEHLN